MADVLKLQSTAGMFDYPDPENPSKGTTEQQYIEFEKNKHSVLSSLVAAELWQPSTFYRTGQVVKSPNMPANVVARAVTNGTSANAEPSWSSAGNTMSDGTVTWAMLYRTIDYATQEEVTAGTNTSKIVTPAMLGKTIKTDLASENAGILNGADKTVVGGVTGILPASHGGTGVASLDDVTVGLAKSLKGDAGLWDYLHRMGENPTLPTTNAALNALGVFMSYFNQKDKFTNQPTTYGQLLNIPADKTQEACQLWIRQTDGMMFHRSGNGSIVINDTPFKRFLDTDDLSAAGVVAGDVSNANAWWVKLGGAVPLIIQGGHKYVGKRYDVDITFPVAYSKVLSIAGLPVVNVANPSGRGLECIKTYSTTSFVYYSGYDIDGKNLLWLSVGI
nr:MAG TPA: putative tail fiber protein [Caudoviricetes sp.]